MATAVPRRLVLFNYNDAISTEERGENADAACITVKEVGEGASAVATAIVALAARVTFEQDVRGVSAPLVIGFVSQLETQYQAYVLYQV